MTPLRKSLIATVVNGHGVSSEARKVTFSKRVTGSKDFELLFQHSEKSDSHGCESQLMIFKTSDGYGYFHSVPDCISEYTLAAESYCYLYPEKSLEWFIKLGLTQDLREEAKSWIQSVTHG